MPRRSIPILAVALTALALTAAAFAHTSSKTLQGAVGPGFDITLKSGGKAVKTLQAGSYTLTVSDRSHIHNFVLQKPGAAGKAITAVGFLGTKTVTVKLTKGTWKFYCAPHQAAMFGSFRVV